MQACFYDHIFGQHPISGSYTGLGSLDNTNTEEDGAEAIWRRGSLMVPRVRTVWSKVAKVCSVSNNLGLCMEAAKLLPDPNQSYKYHGHLSARLLQ